MPRATSCVHLAMTLAAITSMERTGRASPSETSQTRDDPAPAGTLARRHLALTLGVTDVASAGANGGAMVAGLRYRPYRYFETTFDFGYGLLDGARGVEDRWWLIPEVAVVIPTRRLSLDVGGGFGTATVSGYDSWSAYAAQPFEPRWHITEPAVRGHVGLAVPVWERYDLFARAEVATILVSPSDTTDAVWFGLTIGLQAWLM